MNPYFFDIANILITLTKTEGIYNSFDVQNIFDVLSDIIQYLEGQPLHEQMQSLLQTVMADIFNSVNGSLNINL